METGVRGSGFRSEETTPSPPAHSDVRSRRRVIVERIWPEIDGGRFPIKRTVGETVTVRADIFGDGHDLLAGVVTFRHPPGPPGPPPHGTGPGRDPADGETSLHPR